MIWDIHKNSVYLFDSHSYSSGPDGTSILLEFSFLHQLNDFIRANFLHVVSPETQYDIQSIKVHIRQDAVSLITASLRRNRETENRKRHRHNNENYNELNRKRREKYSELLGSPKHESLKRKRREKQKETYSDHAPFEGPVRTLP